MVTRKYKTLKGLIRANKLRGLKLYDFLNREVYNNNSNKWIKFDLSDDALDEACKLFASVIVSKKNIKRYSEIIKYYNGRLYGIYNRLEILCKRELRGDYTAGQDYDSEMRLFRSSLLKG